MEAKEIPFHFFDLGTHWVVEQEKRMDARFYDKDVIAAREIIEKIGKKNIEIKSVNDFSENVFWPGRFKRSYVSKSKGEPFIMPSEALMFLPKPRKFVKDYPEDIRINKNWLLITRSGSVGRILISNDLLENCVLSDDLIRVIPNDIKNFGYLYAYLNTWMGQAFLVKDQYGATVKHIEPHHVSAIPVPSIPRIEKKINERIIQAHKLREEAQIKLLKAEEMIYLRLGLPKINEEKVSYFGNDLGRITKSFGVNSYELDFRLDASYHTPTANFVIKNLKKTKCGTIFKLGNIAKTFVPPRFKRAYVKDLSNGTPLLQGSHITQINPQDLKFIWKGMRKLEKYIVKKNWILVTCSGTIGRLSLVMSYWNGWTATNHLLRIVPDGKKIHPGYLNAFLLSDYGQILFQKLIYGGVVDEIGEAGELFNEIPIIKPAKEKVEEEIGNLVFEAYQKRDKANQIENEFINLLEKEIKKLTE